jgi:hypothetical protein
MFKNKNIHTSLLCVFINASDALTATFNLNNSAQQAVIK